ncbi:DUF3603 family protein [Saliterribacillus persicus]|uniref:Uncharacterized protein DUF3603 n=1 Tax=Saliterribacillus persicus TaxID=930114 RepID=A0A368XP04_9BACI|nr:DUF3603 family protein [Saliterribacillus persicus]RCW69730.1 uncharacterized protein DUF3603 [Saliterribacillus persicus]
MLYLHDVWVNWFEGEENGYNVCHFHEWRKTDQLELLDQVPLLFITKELFHQVENDLQDLPVEMLHKIYKRAYLRKNQQRKVMEYCCVITDGVEIVVFDTLGYSIPIRKSRLIPRQERLVFETIQGRMRENFTPKGKVLKESHILSLPTSQMIGLTRKERQLKQLVMMAIDQLECIANTEEIRYWLTEWQPHRYKEIRKMTRETAWNILYQELVHGWSDKHEDFCRKLIRGQEFLDHLWNKEEELQRP